MILVFVYEIEITNIHRRITGYMLVIKGALVNHDTQICNLNLTSISVNIIFISLILWLYKIRILFITHDPIAGVTRHFFWLKA